MPCFVAILALFFPRLAILILAIFTTYLSRALNPTGYPLILGILGFLFLPFTTLAYALAINQNGSVAGPYLILVIIAVILDLGAHGSLARPRRRTKAVRTYRPR